MSNTYMTNESVGWDSPINSALRVGSTFTKLYLLGPAALQQCLQSLATATNVDAAALSWLNGYLSEKSGSPFPDDANPIYLDGYRFSYIEGETISGRHQEAEHARI